MECVAIACVTCRHWKLLFTKDVGMCLISNSPTDYNKYCSNWLYNPKNPVSVKGNPYVVLDCVTCRFQDGCNGIRSCFKWSPHLEILRAV